MEIKTRPGRPSLSDIAALLKPGIVASNTFTAVAGAALALGLRGPASPAQALGSLGLAALGTALAVAGSCAINNWIDRDIDAAMARTRSRPTVTGVVGRGLALGLGFGLVLGGTLLLLLLSGPAPAVAALAGSIAYVVPYTLWSKRRGRWSSLIGGASGAVPPLIGWAVVDPGLGGPALLLFAFLVVWQQAHVRALALKREGDYRRAGVPMAGLGEERRGSISGGRRWLLCAWIALLLPLPLIIAWQVGGVAAAVFGWSEALACAAWLIWGLLASRPSPTTYSGAWGRRMFFISLAYLILFFAGLFALAVAGLVR